MMTHFTINKLFTALPYLSTPYDIISSIGAFKGT